MYMSMMMMITGISEPMRPVIPYLTKRIPNLKSHSLGCTLYSLTVGGMRTPDAVILAGPATTVGETRRGIKDGWSAGSVKVAKVVFSNPRKRILVMLTVYVGNEMHCSMLEIPT